MASQLAVTIGHHSSAGRKPANQDFHGALVPEGQLLAEKGLALAVADGISTSRQAAVAAETAVKSFLTDYFATSAAWSVQTSAERVIAAANSWMFAQNRRAGRTLSDEEREQGMVTTFSAVVVKSRSAHLFHVGDARIARLSGGGIDVLTEPHRVWLGGGESYLGRALGMNRHVEIDYRQVAVAPGDLFLLSTDGVHEHLADGEIRKAVELAAGDLDRAARAIVDAALDAGSPDNLTVQLLRIDNVPAGVLDDLIGADGSLPPAPRLEPGRDFEGYAILRELHAGSRRHVYLARDLADGAKVALKVPSTEQGQDAAALQALLLEEWIARRIDHPHVLRAAPQRAGRRHAYVVTEFVEGRTLDQWRRDTGTPDLVQVRSLVRQIAAGLQAFHRREMIHRDLRPRNVMVDADETVKLIDFGSAQVAGLDDIAPPAAGEGAYAGTMQYSAPELYLGEAATSRSDIFSLGVIAYELLTGALPYGAHVAGARSPAAQRRLRYVPASERDAEIPGFVDAALARAVAIDPSARYSELSEFVYDLAHPNPTLTAPEQRPLFARRPERLWQAVSLALAIALVVLILRVG